MSFPLTGLILGVTFLFIRFSERYCRKYKGIYVCERSSDKLKKKIEYILKNYKKIQIKMKKNILASKKDFQNKLIKSINE